MATIFSLAAPARPSFAGRADRQDQQICNIPADAALGLEDYPQAIELHLNLLRAHPDNALAHYHLGFAYAMVGQQAAELREYQTAAALGLRQWDLYLNLGLVYFDRGNPNQAAAAFEHAALLAPNRFEPRYNLALVDESQHRFRDALAEVIRAHDLAPDDANVANTHAIICFQMGDVTCAREIWTEQLKKSPDNYAARANLALLEHASDKKTSHPIGNPLKLADGR